MRWSPRVRIPILGRFLTLNWGRRGFSVSSRLGPVTLNSRGGYSINGPGMLDFRGKWRNPSRKPRRRQADGVVSPSARFAGMCGVARPGVSPCKLPPHDGGWHIPEGGEDPWRAAWGNGE